MIGLIPMNIFIKRKEEINVKFKNNFQKRK